MDTLTVVFDTTTNHEVKTLLAESFVVFRPKWLAQKPKYWLLPKLRCYELFDHFLKNNLITKQRSPKILNDLLCADRLDLFEIIRRKFLSDKEIESWAYYKIPKLVNKTPEHAILWALKTFHFSSDKFRSISQKLDFLKDFCASGKVEILKLLFKTYAVNFKDDMRRSFIFRILALKGVEFVDLLSFAENEVPYILEDLQSKDWSLIREELALCTPERLLEIFQRIWPKEPIPVDKIFDYVLVGRNVELCKFCFENSKQKYVLLSHIKGRANFLNFPIIQWIMDDLQFEDKRTLFSLFHLKCEDVNEINSLYQKHKEIILDPHLLSIFEKYNGQGVGGINFRVLGPRAKCHTWLYKILKSKKLTIPIIPGWNESQALSWGTKRTLLLENLTPPSNELFWQAVQLEDTEMIELCKGAASFNLKYFLLSVNKNVLRILYKIFKKNFNADIMNHLANVEYDPLALIFLIKKLNFAACESELIKIAADNQRYLGRGNAKIEAKLIQLP